MNRMVLGGPKGHGFRVQGFWMTGKQHHAVRLSHLVSFFLEEDSESSVEMLCPWLTRIYIYIVKSCYIVLYLYTVIYSHPLPMFSCMVVDGLNKFISQYPPPEVLHHVVRCIFINCSVPQHPASMQRLAPSAAPGAASAARQRASSGVGISRRRTQRTIPGNKKLLVTRA